MLPSPFRMKTLPGAMVWNAVRAAGILLACSPVVRAEQPGPVAKWSFEESAAASAHDSATGADDQILGLFSRVPGVSGSALRFDGMTTAIVRAGSPAAKGAKAAEAVPQLGNSFTLSAWVALNAYPWNWVPIVDHDRDDQAGYSFGIDALGHLGLRAAVNGSWQSVASTRRLPLKRWASVAATFDGDSGMTLYIDGEEAAHLAVSGEYTPAQDTDLIIGRIRRPERPFVPTGAIHPIDPRDPVWYSLDGILDEVEILPGSVGAEGIRRIFASVHAPAGDVLPWAKFPSGPAGPGRFGAYPCTLAYEESWDRMRRKGPGSDVVVRFDRSAMRLVFWQGTGYVPAWVTENGKWYTDEFLEAYGPPGCTGGEDCEPMSDKQTRYSHASILESSPARAVVHWRYMPCETRNYAGSFADPITGWSDWVDEYWTVYPDGIAVRKQVLWSSEHGEWAHEWQETIIVNPPGQRPEDSINFDALTLANMKGESATYSWTPKEADTFDIPKGPGEFPRPDGPNIQVVNLKSRLKPFQIVPPAGVKILPYYPNGDKSYSAFGWWNHWPVAQIPSSDRPAQAADRPSHSSLSHLYWAPYQEDDRSVSKLLLCGLTESKAADLVPLARSWLNPPKMEVSGAGFQSEGYDPAERAFVLRCGYTNGHAPLDIALQASAESPLFDPVVIVRGWDTRARVIVDGKTLVPGESFRIGSVQRLDSVDLVIWMEMESHQPTRIEIDPVSGD